MRKIVYIPPEQIASVLREAETLIAAGKSIAEVARILGISELSYHSWRQEYGDHVRHRRERREKKRAA